MKTKIYFILFALLLVATNLLYGQDTPPTGNEKQGLAKGMIDDQDWARNKNVLFPWSWKKDQVCIGINVPLFAERLLNVKGSSQFNGNIYLGGDWKTSEHYNIYSHGSFQTEQGSGGTGIILKMCDPKGMNAPIIKWDLTSNPSIKRLHAIYQWRKNLVFCSFADNLNNDRQDIMFLNDSTNAVGIGTSEPAQKLEVKGAIKIDYTKQDVPGTIRWNPQTKHFEGFDGTAWKQLDN